MTVTRNGFVTLDLALYNLALTPDGLVAVYSYVQGYVAWVGQKTVLPITPTPQGIRFAVTTADRSIVLATLAAILARPGTLQPADQESRE
jgi:hypothetical protein